MHSLTAEARLQVPAPFHIFGGHLFLPAPHIHTLEWSAELKVLGITVQSKFLAVIMGVLGVGKTFLLGQLKQRELLGRVLAGPRRH